LRAGIRALLPVQELPVALDADLELGELAVGGALRAPGHLPARGETQEGFGDPEGSFAVAAPLVEEGESLVGVAAYELFGDARLVQADSPLGVAALLGPLGLHVALDGGVEAAQGVVLRPDPLLLGWVEAEEL
jgi:hypothetical protein